MRVETSDIRWASIVLASRVAEAADWPARAAIPAAPVNAEPALPAAPRAAI